MTGPRVLGLTFRYRWDHHGSSAFAMHLQFSTLVLAAFIVLAGCQTGEFAEGPSEDRAPVKSADVVDVPGGSAGLQEAPSEDWAATEFSDSGSSYNEGLLSEIHMATAQLPLANPSNFENQTFAGLQWGFHNLASHQPFCREHSAGSHARKSWQELPRGLAVGQWLSPRPYLRGQLGERCRLITRDLALKLRLPSASLLNQS